MTERVAAYSASQRLLELWKSPNEVSQIRHIRDIVHAQELIALYKIPQTLVQVDWIDERKE